MSDPVAPWYRLVVGRWQVGYFAEWNRPLEWTWIQGLDFPDRGILEELALRVLRLPEVVAVRIDEVPPPSPR